jgi:hypothetical protein
MIKYRTNICILQVIIYSASPFLITTTNGSSNTPKLYFQRILTSLIEEKNVNKDIKADKTVYKRQHIM